jgi:hypothetical protein
MIYLITIDELKAFAQANAWLLLGSQETGLGMNYEWLTPSGNIIRVFHNKETQTIKIENYVLTRTYT